MPKNKWILMHRFGNLEVDCQNTNFFVSFLSWMRKKYWNFLLASLRLLNKLTCNILLWQVLDRGADWGSCRCLRMSPAPPSCRARSIPPSARPSPWSQLKATVATHFFTFQWLFMFRYLSIFFIPANAIYLHCTGILFEVYYWFNRFFFFICWFIKIT